MEQEPCHWKGHEEEQDDEKRRINVGGYENIQ